jgi:hypothetical protein
MLDIERKYFEKKRPEWLHKHSGKFVLIKGEDALAEGTRRFGTDSFLVRLVEESEETIYIPALTLGVLRANSTHPV